LACTAGLCARPRALSHADRPLRRGRRGAAASGRRVAVGPAVRLARRAGRRGRLDGRSCAAGNRRGGPAGLPARLGGRLPAGRARGGARAAAAGARLPLPAHRFCTRWTPALALRAPVCLPSIPAGGQHRGPPLHPLVRALGRCTPASPARAAAPAAKVMLSLSLEEHERARPPGLAGGRPRGRMRAGRSAVRGRGSGRGACARPAGAGRLTRGAARGVRRRGGGGAAVWGCAAARGGRGRAGRGGAAGGGRARGGRAPAAGLWP